MTVLNMPLYSEFFLSYDLLELNMILCYNLKVSNI